MKSDIQLVLLLFYFVLFDIDKKNVILVCILRSPKNHICHPGNLG